MSGGEVAKTGLRILVLEDHEVQAKFISRMFAEAGASVDIVTSAAEFASSSRLDETSFDAVLIDVHFGNVNGLTLMAPVLSRWPKTAVGMITADRTDDFAILGQAREQGAHFMLPKPFSRSDVEALLVDIAQFRTNRKMRPHVVVVDNNTASCRNGAKLLVSSGYRVSTFQDGLEAIRQISYDRVDVVLTEMKTTDMTDKELICLFRDVWETVAVIALSGDPRVASRVGADTFLPKPYGPDELIRTVRRAISDRAVALDC